jgi:hypothetical protein
MKFYLWQLLIALDQLVNALLFGHADETLSARAYRNERAGKLLGRILRPLIDALFYVITLGRDKHHCKESFESERLRRHLPPVYSLFECEEEGGAGR